MLAKSAPKLHMYVQEKSLSSVLPSLHCYKTTVVLLTLGELLQNCSDLHERGIWSLTVASHEQTSNPKVKMSFCLFFYLLRVSLGIQETKYHEKTHGIDFLNM